MDSISPPVRVLDFGYQSANPLDYQRAGASFAAPSADAVNRYAEGKTAIEQGALQNFYQRAMQDASIAATDRRTETSERNTDRRTDAAERIAAARDKMYLDRQDMRDKSSFDRMQMVDELLRKRIEDKNDLTEANADKKNDEMATVFGYYQSKLDANRERQAKLTNQPPPSDAEVDAASKLHVSTFLKSLQESNLAKYNKLTDAQAGKPGNAYALWLNGKDPVGFDAALQASGAQDDWNEFKTSIRSSIADDRAKHLPDNVRQEYLALEKENIQAESATARILQLHPGAVDIFTQRQMDDQKNGNNIAPAPGFGAPGESQPGRAALLSQPSQPPAANITGPAVAAPFNIAAMQQAPTPILGATAGGANFQPQEVQDPRIPPLGVRGNIRSIFRDGPIATPSGKGTFVLDGNGQVQFIRSAPPMFSPPGSAPNSVLPPEYYQPPTIPPQDQAWLNRLNQSRFFNPTNLVAPSIN